MAKQYKAGQIITIGHHIYKIKKKKYDHLFGRSWRCGECAYCSLSLREDPCFSCAWIFHLKRGLYLKRIK